MTTTVRSGRAQLAVAIAQESRPGYIQIAIRRGRAGREAVVPEGSVGQRNDILQFGHFYRLAEGRTAVGRLDDVSAVKRSQPSRPLENHIHGAIVTDDRPRTLVV